MCGHNSIYNDDVPNGFASSDSYLKLLSIIDINIGIKGFFKVSALTYADLALFQIWLR